MAYVKIYLHTVWGTKNRFPFLKNEVRHNVINHILENAKKKGIVIVKINGYLDHLHCLIRLNPDMSIGTAVNLIKGESSYWINKEKICDEKFYWADEYYSESVSALDLPRVINYIANQETHHQKISFKDEYDGMMKSDIKNQEA